MNKNLNQILLSGYLHSVFASFLGTLFFVFVNTIISAIKYSTWTDAFVLFLIPGGVFSLVFAGVGGVILAYLLWRDAKGGLLSERKAFFTGGIVGLDSILFVLLLAYMSPLYTVFIRMPFGILAQYTIHLTTLSFFLGGWTGKKIAIMLNKQLDLGG